MQFIFSELVPRERVGGMTSVRPSVNGPMRVHRNLSGEERQRVG